MSKDKMLAVRFPADMVAAIRRFAREDGVSASALIRRLVASELKNPQRAAAVDYTQYGPQPQTVASGAVKVEFDIQPVSASCTGCTP